MLLIPTSNPTTEPTLRSPVLECGDIINGSTDFAYDIDWYRFIVLNNVSKILFDSCGSQYDTYLYFNNNDGSSITWCDDCGECGRQTQLTIHSVAEGSYQLGMF